MATIYEVAKTAGVSLATVSRVINGNSNVREKTKEKVEQAMHELGYQPSSIAQSLASNRSNRVGIVVAELDGPFYSNMLATVERVLRHAGKHAIITAGHSDESKEKDAIRFLQGCNCDALILCVDALADDYLLTLTKQPAPVAVINHRIEELPDHCFTVDNELGGYRATKAVLEQGHQQIAYISGPAFKEDAKLRLQGHRRALLEAGVEVDERLIFEGNYHEDGGIAGFTALLNTGLPFSALVCGNDDMASGAMQAARKVGLKLPTDLSVVGFDDLLFARYTYPTLTSVKNPIAEMGEMAANWILQKTYKLNEECTITNVFEPVLVARDSVGPCAR